jgi:hypothetical protein
MAFTVEFDDESPKMNISGKLEDFMPSKVRRSFRGRSDKQPKTSEDSSKEEVTLVKFSNSITNLTEKYFKCLIKFLHTLTTLFHV